MQLTIEQIGAMIADSFKVGYMEAVKAYEPTSDELKASDIKKWCQATFTDYSRLRRLIRAGIVKPHRKGTAKNSPLLYSKAEIKKAAIQARLTQLIADDEATAAK